MTKRHRRANLGVTNKEKQMAGYEGIPGTAPPSGVIFVPENIPHYFDDSLPGGTPGSVGILQVVAVGYNAAGQIPASDPAPENQAPGYHRAAVVPDPTKPTPDWVKVGSPPDPFTPGWTDNPATNPAAKWVVGVDANGDYVYGNPPAAAGSVQAQAAALAVAANELSWHIATGGPGGPMEKK
jgi:hypothetical protein